MLKLTELGNRLKEARTSKGYSLDDLQEITKIQKRYLVGIEEGNYDIMPGSFYVRAFIKQYAEAVGLNPEELIMTYKNDVPGSQTEQVTQSMSKSPSRRKISTGPSNKLLEALPMYIVALFIIVIIIAVTFLYIAKTSGDSNDPIVKEPPIQIDKAEPIESDKDKEKPEEVVAPVVEEPTVSQAISEGILDPDGETTNYSLTGAEELKVRVEVSGSTWVGVKDRESWTELVKPADRVFNAGEVVEVDATTSKSIRIRLGESSNAKVYVNDELIKYTRAEQGTQNIVIIKEQ